MAIERRDVLGEQVDRLKGLGPNEVFVTFAPRAAAKHRMSGSDMTRLINQGRGFPHRNARVVDNASITSPYEKHVAVVAERIPV
ncbi:MAG TPA: hypothetical protein VLG67_00950 [Candidatus Saccharimonadales bacterium]|nr:hypothetical protein [Candidatus Saccharimonadales bacterium]